MSQHDWVIVHTGGSADTALLRDLLEAAGITARLGDEAMGTIAPYVIAGGTQARSMVKARARDCAASTCSVASQASASARPRV